MIATGALCLPWSLLASNLMSLLNHHHPVCPQPLSLAPFPPNHGRASHKMLPLDICSPVVSRDHLSHGDLTIFPRWSPLLGKFSHCRSFMPDSDFSSASSEQQPFSSTACRTQLLGPLHVPLPESCSCPLAHPGLILCLILTVTPSSLATCHHSSSPCPGPLYPPATLDKLPNHPGPGQFWDCLREHHSPSAHHPHRCQNV